VEWPETPKASPGKAKEKPHPGPQLFGTNTLGTRSAARQLYRLRGHVTDAEISHVVPQNVQVVHGRGAARKSPVPPPRMASVRIPQQTKGGMDYRRVYFFINLLGNWVPMFVCMYSTHFVHTCTRLVVIRVPRNYAVQRSTFCPTQGTGIRDTITYTQQTSTTHQLDPSKIPPSPPRTNKGLYTDVSGLLQEQPVTCRFDS
jgi:hypothetical protein